MKERKIDKARTLEKRKRHHMMHSMTRFFQRYNKPLLEGDYKKMVSLIQRGKCQNLETIWDRTHESLDRTTHLLNFNQQKIVAVYSSTTQEIVTFLPLEVLDE